MQWNGFFEFLWLAIWPWGSVGVGDLVWLLATEPNIGLAGANH